MNVTLYANFPDAAQAEQALAALLDRGADRKDLSAVFPATYQSHFSGQKAVEEATSGITTTTAADAAAGAEKGGVIGLALGALAALASLVIPGVGLVTGGGALAMALTGVVGTTAGGALAGGVAGFLKDQGVPERVALDYESALKNGRAIIMVDTPTGKIGEAEVREIFSKYHATHYVASPAAIV